MPRLDDPREADPAEALLAKIRHAAFELRETDPQEAVRILRTAAAQGGETEVLARGALGEIYLDELGDLDGAEAEFRRVLSLSPGLTAAEIGLARTLREQGRRKEADATFQSAIDGLSRDAAELRGYAEAGEELPPGVEELWLTLLEVAVELSQLREESKLSKGSGALVAEAPRAPLIDEGLLTWAQAQRLFDAEQDDGGADAEDWLRFHLLWSELRRLTGRRGEIVAALDRAEAAGELPGPLASQLRSDAHEADGDFVRAAREGRLALDGAGADTWEPDEVLRVCALFAAAGDDAGARTLLGQAQQAFQARRSALADEPDAAEELAALDEALGRFAQIDQELKTVPGAPGLIKLGLRGGDA